MKVVYFRSLEMDISMLKGKRFKLLADLIRSGVKNQHGFRAQKGLTDDYLKEGPFTIRFRTAKHRERFISLFNTLLCDRLLEKIKLRKTKPRKPSTRPIRFARVK
jgi:hypothetical protein